jgi:hypothetical protein
VKPPVTGSKPGQAGEQKVARAGERYSRALK